MNIVSSKVVGISTVKKLLENQAKEEEELGYEQQQALEYAEKFSKMDEKAVAKLVAELVKTEKLNDETAFKIADILPAHLETLKAILVKDKLDLSEEELKNVFEIVQKSSK